jgi:hypothetical protein
VIDVARSEDGSIRLRLEGIEANALRGLVAEMRKLLHQRPADDAVMQQLFPDAYDDDARSRAFRELTGDDLASLKVEALARVESDLGERGSATATLHDDGIEAWLATLTDMRLAIGTRLGVDERRMSAEPDPEDAAYPSLTMLHWLGWLQESILAAEGA